MKKSGIIIFKNIRLLAHLVESLKNDRQGMNVIQIALIPLWKKEIFNK